MWRDGGWKEQNTSNGNGLCQRPLRSHVAEKWLSKGRAGKDWYYQFMTRHPELSLHTPEKNFVKGPSQDGQWNHFGKFLQRTRICCNTEWGIPQARFNADEWRAPGFSATKSKSTCSLWSLYSGDKTNTTILACDSASGVMMHPLILYKGIRRNPWLIEGAPDGWGVDFTQPGWINSVAFEKWFEFSFVPYVNNHVRSSMDEKIILLGINLMRHCIC